MYDLIKNKICPNWKTIDGKFIIMQEKLPQSPYIVKYYGGTVLKYDGNTVVVTLMELCPGGNLFDLL